jgi:lysophospholipase L1-like esterase
MTKIGRVAARLGLVVAALALSLGLAELGARMVPPPATTLGDDGTDPNDTLWSDPDWRSPPPRTFQSDPDIGFVHAPFQAADVPIGEHPGRKFRFRTNGYGLRRDDEISVERQPDTFRVLVLGDSQTGGYVSNDEGFPRLLEEYWEQHGATTRVELLNAGVIGYAPQQEYLWYLKHGWPLQPNVVLLMLYVGNDARDLVDGEVDAAVVDEEAGLIGPLRSTGAWLGLHSRLARVAYTAARSAPLSPLLSALGMRTPPPPLPFSAEALVRVLRECHGCWLQALKQDVHARSRPELFDIAYARLELVLRLLDQHVTASGGRLVIVVLPTKMQVEPEDDAGAMRRSLRLLGLSQDVVAYSDEARARMLAAARAANVRLIDPLPELQQASRNGRLYYRRDWHLNVRGNQAMTQILATSLATLELLPPGVSSR